MLQSCKYGLAGGLMSTRAGRHLLALTARSCAAPAFARWTRRGPARKSAWFSCEGSRSLVPGRSL